MQSVLSGSRKLLIDRRALLTGKGKRHNASTPPLDVHCDYEATVGKVRWGHTPSLYTSETFVGDYMLYSKGTFRVKNHHRRDGIFAPRGWPGDVEAAVKAKLRNLMRSLRKKDQKDATVWTKIKGYVIGWILLAEILFAEEDPNEYDFIYPASDIGKSSNCPICTMKDKLRSFVTREDDKIITHYFRQTKIHVGMKPQHNDETQLFTVWTCSHDRSVQSLQDSMRQDESDGWDTYYHWIQQFGCLHYHRLSRKRVPVPVGPDVYNLSPLEIKSIYAMNNVTRGISLCAHKGKVLHKKNIFDLPLPLSHSLQKFDHLALACFAFYAYHVYDLSTCMPEPLAVSDLTLFALEWFEENVDLAELFIEKGLEDKIVITRKAATTLRKSLELPCFVEVETNNEDLPL
jgi:hypothetical protein